MLDLTKPVQTRSGRAARIVATDMKGPCPIVAIVSDGGREEVWAYFLDGSFLTTNKNAPSPMDLVNIITPHAVLKQELVESLSGHDEPSAELTAMRERVK